MIDTLAPLLPTATALHNACVAACHSGQGVDANCAIYSRYITARRICEALADDLPMGFDERSTLFRSGADQRCDALRYIHCLALRFDQSFQHGIVGELHKLHTRDKLLRHIKVDREQIATVDTAARYLQIMLQLKLSGQEHGSVDENPMFVRAQVADDSMVRFYSMGHHTEATLAARYIMQPSVHGYQIVPPDTVGTAVLYGEQVWNCYHPLARVWARTMPLNMEPRRLRAGHAQPMDDDEVNDWVQGLHARPAQLRAQAKAAALAKVASASVKEEQGVWDTSGNVEQVCVYASSRN
eukprot:COSAG01_NODE_5768_length_4046_cov_1.760578_5_plen_297_part_00